MGNDFKVLPPGASFRLCRKMIRNMFAEIYSPRIDPSIRSVAHIHLVTAVTGMTLSDSWTKIGIGSANFHVVPLDGFTFDDVNNRVYWDVDGTRGPLSAFMVGSAGLQVTSGLVSHVTITMGLFIDGVNVIATPLTFSAIDRIQIYGANAILVTKDENHTCLLQPGSYFELFSKAATGETPTVTVNSLNVTIKKD